ncbi:hypothetical protein LEM8419_00696 [Neolewinella maritima]|uniref:Alginate lyase domain-containing protein n=1 Tax=Neolewinella maritima TaxID=1383882 RepID=A0ABN8F0L7_9BACT|nr:alginate lyase family protein [Neolewinella maritima]CAH0999398.1 hypothetical protein LEM8419_00696 [Neolewinella maritima]
MRVLHLPFLLLLAIGLCTCAPPPATNEAIVSDVPASSDFTNYPVAHLKAIRAAYVAEEPMTVGVVERLLEQADAELDGPVYTIVNKEVMPPSGNPKDYLSLGPYWWPDPAKEDGLPWIRRDGEVNPITQGAGTDKQQHNAFSRAVETLSYAAYFSGEATYRERAALLLRAFLIDPETKMNPHLNYAQGIPGHNTGRCFGVIELTDVIDLVTSLEVLQLAGGIDPAVQQGAADWLAAYLDWLQTSELGIEEKTRLNNHGTWYDAQVLSILSYLGREQEARAVAEGVKQRIDSQIEPDGAQPHELERTKSLSYSTMNLRGFTILAYLAQGVGVDLWGYVSPTGGSIPQAYAYLRPYVVGEDEWSYPQLGKVSEALRGTTDLFGRAASLFGADEYCAVQGELAATPDLEDLIYRCE